MEGAGGAETDSKRLSVAWSFAGPRLDGKWTVLIRDCRDKFDMRDCRGSDSHSTTSPLHGVCDTSHFHIITWPVGQACVTGSRPLSVHAILCLEC